jgi:YidC/Oxa1 family membrane protein insertase
MLEDPKEKTKSRLRETVAIVLLVGIAFYFFSRPPQQTNTKVALTDTQSNEVSSLDSHKSSSTSLNVVPAMINSKIKETVVKKETQRYLLGFSSYYGTLNQIVLKDYKDSNKKNFVITPNLMDYQNLPLLFTVDGYSLQQGFKVSQKENKVTFTQQEGALTLEKTYTLNPKNFDLNLDVRVKNNGKQDIFSKMRMSWGKGLGPFLPKELQISYDKQVVLSYFDNESQSNKELKRGETNIVSELSWMSIDNRYFAVAIMPQQVGKYQLTLVNHSSQAMYDETLQMVIPLHLAGGESLTKSYKIYMGPKDKKLMAVYHNNLERISERGWFFFPLLGSFLISILTFFKSMTGSYAIAIIIFGILLRLIFHPLNSKSMLMMSKQAGLQEKIKAIKEKHSDKATQNVKIMELYRQENVSLYKGCLPLLIQIPFFISFYSELPGLISLASEHFLWIKDLSSPDTVLTISSFKNIPLLPYRLNILPLIIAAFTFFQMKVSSKNSTTVNPQTKIMMYLMPIIFLFILWNAPSGLNLYWLVQTIGTILAQLHFNRNKSKILLKSKEKAKARKKIKSGK